jgi:YbgC/YbaW family acyl-CoA thioester hydrolase
LRQYCLKRRVLFYETDAAGIVHFSMFFRYMEEAEHALWRSAGISVHPPDGSGVGWPRVKATCEYHRALRFEQEFEVTVRVSEINRRTVTFVSSFTRGDDAIATGHVVVACVQQGPNGTMKSMEIPADIVARLRGGQ